MPDALQVSVVSTQDVLDVMERGQSNRATADTKMNERSSRSHSVLTVIVSGQSTVTRAMSHGCLHLIDLAGSERVGRSEASGERLEEAKYINKSLSSIGDVMAALAEKRKHVPFRCAAGGSWRPTTRGLAHLLLSASPPAAARSARAHTSRCSAGTLRLWMPRCLAGSQRALSACRNSKLTQLLADSLSGQAKVMMFLHVSPEASSFGESLSTLKFGARVSDITLGQAKRNVEAGSTLQAREAQARARHAGVTIHAPCTSCCCG